MINTEAMDLESILILSPLLGVTDLANYLKSLWLSSKCLSISKKGDLFFASDGISHIAV